MKKRFLCFALIMSCLLLHAQEGSNFHEKGKAFMRQGDYEKASPLLIKAFEQDPSNTAIAKDLAFNYYFLRENGKALEIIKPLLDKDGTDEQVFQIAGNIYRAMDMLKETEALYKKAIRKFPKNGVMYNGYGEFLSLQQNANAINQWEKGIEMDPSYSNNYYNAAKYYYFTTDKIWGIIYAEIFLNIEPQSARTAEVKNILLDSYKKLFADTELSKITKDKNSFEKAFLQTISKEISLASGGLTAETLTMIRTRFIINWFENYADNFPYKLFDLHRQLLREGMFDAYNQWIFGATQNLDAYQKWTASYSTEYSEFTSFQKGRIFKIPAGQYYHK